MEFDDPMPSIEQETLPDLPLNGVSTNNEALLQSTGDHASLNSASATPLPPSSPVSASQLTPRLRMEVASPQTQSPVHLRSSRPSKADRRSSTPLQTIRRSPSNSYIASSNTTPRVPTVRRASSNLVPPSTPSSLNSRSSSTSTIQDMERKTTVTASSVAQEYFKKELHTHENVGTTSRTIVILRDSCYGHRYSRPRTSKAGLSTIVERPERIHACVLGASTAYVRIGSRHAGGRYPPHPDRQAPPPPFRIRKTTRSIPLNYAAVTQVHGQKWMEELQIMCDSAEGKLAMNGKELVRSIGYGKDEAGNSLPKLHEGDLYLCSQSLDALQGCLGGVCEAVDTVFGPEHTTRAFVCIRPPGHHCSSNFPSGFCWLNNVHVGIAHAAMTQGLTHAAIIDFDLHHGDGSQAIAWDHNLKAAGNLPKNASPYSKTPIGYFSLHDINSYPCEWGDEEKIKNASLCVENAHGQSIWNVHLEPWKNHTDFWRLYESRYSVLLDKTRIFLRHHTANINSKTNSNKAKAAIFLSAGFDASEWEGAGMQRHKVNVPTDFYARFTSDVVKLAEEEGLGVEGRVISVLEGGYSDRALTSGVLSHICGLTDDSGDEHVQVESVETGLASAMAKKMGMLSLSRPANGDKPAAEQAAAGMAYNPDWWAHYHLEALEAMVNPVPESLAKVKDKVGGNYSSPTQASTAKMTDPVRARKSLSGPAEGRVSTEPESLPPPPDVEWAVASYELSRLLIPTDRQTLSCRHDELNAEATKVRRERQSTIGLPFNESSSEADQRMQLRDRKAKAPVANENLKEVPKADRRRTIAAIADLPDQESLHNGSNTVNLGLANTRPRRRSSASSSIVSAFEGMNLNERGGHTSGANAVTSRGKATPIYNDAKMPTIPAIPVKTTKMPIQKKVKQLPEKNARPPRTKTMPRKTETAPPVAKLPSALAKSSSEKLDETQKTESNKVPPLARSSESATSMVGDDNDLDAIATGMRKMKINLKVPSPAENAARERKVAEEKDQLKKSRVARKAVVPKAAKSAPTKKDSKSSNSVADVPSSTATSTTIEQHGGPVDVVTSLISPQQRASNGPNAQQTAPTDKHVPIPDIAHAEPPIQATNPAPVSAPMETRSIAPTASSVHDPRSAPLMMSSNRSQTSSTGIEPELSSPRLPPHPPLNESSDLRFSGSPASAPATAMKTRADLPRFTASSPIPFAKVDADFPSTRLAKADTDNVSSHTDLDAPPSSEVFGARALLDRHAIQQEAKQDMASPMKSSIEQQSATTLDPSIWEVPETPRH